MGDGDGLRGGDGIGGRDGGWTFRVSGRVEEEWRMGKLGSERLENGQIGKWFFGGDG